MCAEFILSNAIHEFACSQGAVIALATVATSETRRILPHTKAAVLHTLGAGLDLSEMAFSLTPAWSKERRVSYATYNARLDSLALKPTWRIPFSRQRAVVAMDGFIEPCYQGEFAGSMVRFSPRASAHEPSQTPLWCAALYDRWIDRTTKEELLSFALITDQPGTEVHAIGHDRQPLFIKSSSLCTWLDPALTTPDQIHALVPGMKATPQLQTKVERAMRPGWERRRKES